jgi:transcriptional regulator with XRE-family HTH domain
MATLGQQLKVAREAKGLSQSEAGAATKILTRVIAAMEADDFSGMAAPTYAKGFIRLYAGYLGLKPEPLIEEYLNRHAPGPKRLVNEESQLEQNLHTLPTSTAFLKRIGAPANLFSKTRKQPETGHHAESATGVNERPLKQRPAKDIKRLAVRIAGALALMVLIVSLANCVRRHQAEKTVQQPAAAPVRGLLDKPLPDLYLVEPGKIESSR